MSMKSWTEPGFGFCIYNSNVDNSNKIMRFIADNAPEGTFTDEQRQSLRDSDDMETFREIADDPQACRVIANIINSMEGTTIVKGYASDGDTDQEEMLGIEPCYPWTLNEKDKSMTEAEAVALLQKYGKMIDADWENIDYFDAEYCG